jgi:hypothetical protein
VLARHIEGYSAISQPLFLEVNLMLSSLGIVSAVQSRFGVEANKKLLMVLLVSGIVQDRFGAKANYRCELPWLIRRTAVINQSRVLLERSNAASPCARDGAMSMWRCQILEDADAMLHCACCWLN